MKTNEERKLDSEVTKFFEKRKDENTCCEEIKGLIIEIKMTGFFISLSKDRSVVLWENCVWLKELEGKIKFKRCVVRALRLLDHSEDIDHAMAWYEQYGLASTNETVLDDMETYRMEQNERR